MASDPWRVTVQDLMLASADEGAAHYREHAAQLREMAKGEPSAKLRADLLDLADKYDNLANSLSG